MSEDTPPDPAKWWRHRRYQSYIGIVGLIALSAMAIVWPVSDAVAGLLEYAGLACILLVVGYGPGSTCVDAIRAWRGGD